MSKEVAKKTVKKTKENLESEVAEKLALLNQKENFENLIKDNKIEFTINKKKYRVRKPTQGESLALQKARNKKFLELLKDDSYILKEQLLEIYKKKGLDIEKMEENIKELGYSIEDIQVKLDNTTEKTSIENFKKEIKEIERKQSKIAVRIGDLLEPCIEHAVIEFGNLYSVYSVLEMLDSKKEVKENVVINDNKWIKAFKTYEDFLNSDKEALILEASANLAMIVYKSKI